jgi:membrane-associated phospholipid phosphatase
MDTIARVEAELHRVAELVHELPFDQRFRAVTLASLVHALTYFSANHFPLSEPRLLPMTAFDAAVPFIPATVFIYSSAYAMVFVAFLSLRRRQSITRFLEVFISCVVVAGFVHWTLPTRYPRELFPIPDDAGALPALALTMLRQVDTPSSCLPSLHVATAMASAVLVYREQPKRFWWFLAWAVAIALSTLTTKQHYVVDVASGTVLAVMATVLVDFVGGLRKRLG